MSENNQNKLPWWTKIFNQEKLKQFQQMEENKHVDLREWASCNGGFCRNCDEYNNCRFAPNLEQNDNER